MKKLSLIVCVIVMLVAYTTCYATEWVSSTSVVDFEQDEANLIYTPETTGTKFLENWNITFELSDVISREKPTVKEENGNKYLSVDAYFVAEYKGALTDKFDLSVDMRKAPVEHLGGIFIHGASQLFPFYDWDSYNEKGGQSTSTNESFLGSSGLAFIPTTNALRIYVKTYEIDGIKDCNLYGVGNEYVELPLSFDTSTKMFKFKIAEENNSIVVYIDDVVMATINMSSVGKYDNLDIDCFKDITIKDKDGNLIKQVNDALVTVENDMIISLRGLTHIDFDNLSITNYEEKTEPETNPKTNDTSVLSYLTIITILAFALLKRKKIRFSNLL